jgi:hypothetical protein
VLGAGQVIRDNAAMWRAVHATVPTVVVQTAAGSVIGGVCLGALVFYWVARRGIRTMPPAARRAEGLAPPAAFGVRQVGRPSFLKKRSKKLL